MMRVPEFQSRQFVTSVSKVKPSIRFGTGKSVKELRPLDRVVFSFAEPTLRIKAVNDSLIRYTQTALKFPQMSDPVREALAWMLAKELLKPANYHLQIGTLEMLHLTLSKDEELTAKAKVKQIGRKALNIIVRVGSVGALRLKQKQEEIPEAGEAKRIAAKALHIILQNDKNKGGRFNQPIVTFCRDSNPYIKGTGALSAQYITKAPLRDEIIRSLLRVKEPNTPEFMPIGSPRDFVLRGAAQATHYLSDSVERSLAKANFRKVTDAYCRISATRDVPYETFG
jgi:hypothetical protein